MVDIDTFQRVPHVQPGVDATLNGILAAKLTNLMQTVASFGNNIPAVPGCVFMVRRDGQPFVSVAAGWARMPTGAPGSVTVDDHLPMSEETVVHIASMAKSICAVAVAALMDDWNNLFERLRHLPAPPTANPPAMIDPDTVPAAIRPLFEQPRLAMRIDGELMPRIPPRWRPWVVASANRPQAASIPPRHTYPFAAGLLISVLRLWDKLTPATPVLRLMHRRLVMEAHVAGLTVVSRADTNLLTLMDLLRHESGLREEDATDGNAAEPADGLASYPLWPRVINVLNDGRIQAAGYRNVNFSILGAVIEAVTEQRYTDWVRFRVLGDATRFPAIERRAVPRALAAKYYPDGFATLANPAATGVFHPDYTNWSANGGFYVTASEFTDWMYAVYAGLPVRGGTPIVSGGGRTLLFGADPIFSGGNRLSMVNTAGTAYYGFEKNGGTGVAGGSTNGNLKIFTPQHAGGPVYTAFVLMNGAAAAERFFDPLFAELMAHLP